YHVGVNAHRERGRTFWIVMVALAALVAGLATAISQWRAQRPGPAGVEVPAPADTGESIIGQALAQIPVDSTPLNNRCLDSGPGIACLVESLPDPMQAGSTRRSAPMVVEEDPMPFPKLTPRTFSSIRELNGISARTMEEHYELYKGYVAKTNEIQDKLGAVDR